MYFSPADLINASRHQQEMIEDPPLDTNGMVTPVTEAAKGEIERFTDQARLNHRQR
jgi:hypothetical protein